MTQTPQEKLEAALAVALPKVGAAKKGSNNPHFKSKYADLSAVIDAIRPVAEDGIGYRQVLHEGQDGVTVETLYTGFGATISAGTLFMPAAKRDAQGFGSALTYARRYALQTAFGLATEDDDGNAAVKTAPEPREEADKPAHSKLKTELRAFVHELEGCGDWETYVAFRETPDFKRITKECQDKMPQWWHGGEDMAEEFVPIKRRIELTEVNLAEGKAALIGV